MLVQRQARSRGRRERRAASTSGRTAVRVWRPEPVGRTLAIGADTATGAVPLGRAEPHSAVRVGWPESGGHALVVGADAADGAVLSARTEPICQLLLCHSYRLCGLGG